METLHYELTNGIARLRLNRPTALNALSVKMMEELRDVTNTIKNAGNEVHVVLLEAAGAHFMAGGDIKDFAQINAYTTMAARKDSYAAMVRNFINPSITNLRQLHQPIVCKVQGACAGFGLALMLTADLAICADDAYFTTAYQAIALPCDGGLSYYLPRIVGQRKARELMLLGERFDSSKALQLGIVNRVVERSNLDEHCETLLRQLANGPRHAYAEIKRLLANDDDLLSTQLEQEAEAFSRCASTQDFAEGISAFGEKRSAKFQGK